MKKFAKLVFILTLVLLFCPLLGGFAFALPNQVTMSVSNPGTSFGDPSYFDTTISGGTDLDGTYDGWSVDTDNTISPSTNYTANVYYSYELLPVGLVEYPENLDLVNWIINQGYVGQSSACDGSYTYGDVQRAIWSIVEDNNATIDLGPWSQCRVDEILAAANANGEGFVPTIGEDFAVILQPTGGQMVSIIPYPIFEADLSIFKESVPYTVTPGETFEYWIYVSKYGSDSALNVEVTDILPAGVTFVETNGCTNDPNGYPTCTLGEISSFDYYSITVTVDATTSPGIISNTATVTSYSTDPDTSNNLFTWDTVVATAVSTDTLLTSDLTSALKVVADNITLNCDGHTITGDGIGEGIFVEDRTGVTVENCTVRSFNNGIKLDYSTYITLKSNTTENNQEDGIDIEGTNFSLVKNNFTENNGEYGIHIGGDYNTVTDNTVRYNVGTGIRFSDGDSNTVKNNLVTHNSTGIVLGDSRLNTLKENTSNSNENYGFEIGDANDNTFIKNWAEDNGHSGWLICVTDCTFNKNTSIDNGGYGFEIYKAPPGQPTWCWDNADTNTFKKNECTGNTVGGSNYPAAAAGELCSPQQ